MADELVFERLDGVAEVLAGAAGDVAEQAAVGSVDGEDAAAFGADE